VSFVVQNFVSFVVKVKRPKPFLSWGELVLSNNGEREKDVDVKSDSAEYPGPVVSMTSSSRTDEEHENRNPQPEASSSTVGEPPEASEASSSTVGEPISPIPDDDLPKVSLSLSSQVSEEMRSSENDETFHPVPLIFRDVTQISEVNYSYSYSAVEESFHPDQNSFLALIDARLQPLQVQGSTQPSVVALQEHDYTESLFPAANDRDLTESLFPGADEGDLTESLFPGADERNNVTESLFPASEERHLTESLFTGLEDHTYTMSIFPDESVANE
jgi:hypothetical protein